MNPRAFLDSRVAPLALFLLCLVLHLSGTWALPLMDRDEPRFAEASREMLERGDYVVPFFNGQPRYDKPPLIYWCQAASYRVFGENEFAARFPSSLAGALTAVVVFGFGARLFGRKIGAQAALVFSLSLQVLVHSRASVADMCMVLFVALASWAGWEVSAARSPRRFWWWTFYVALALGFLAKGPVAWLPIGTVLLAQWWTPRESTNRELKLQWGIPVMLGLIALWGVPALLRTDGEFLRVGIGRHVIERSFVALEGHGAKGWLAYLALLPFYFVTVLISFLPWSFLLPRLVSDLRKERTLGAAERYLISGIVLTFAIFTLLSTKLPHYILPAFPLLSILFAARFGESGIVPRWSAVTAGVWLIVSLAVLPLGARFFPVAQLARLGEPWLKADMRFATVEVAEPSVIWSFRKNIRHRLEPRPADEILAFMKQPGPAGCVLPTTLAATLDPDPSWKTFTAEGLNIATGKRLQLTLWIKAE